MDFFSFLIALGLIGAAVHYFYADTIKSWWLRIKSNFKPPKSK